MINLVALAERLLSAQNRLNILTSILKKYPCFRQWNEQFELFVFSEKAFLRAIKECEPFMRVGVQLKEQILNGEYDISTVKMLQSQLDYEEVFM